MTDFNTLLAAANQAFSHLRAEERELLKKERACRYIFSGLLLTPWSGRYADITQAYDERFEELH